MTSEVLHADNNPPESMVSSIAIFLGGTAIGAVAALLLAPQAGRESRKQLSDYGRRTGQTMREWATTASNVFATGEKAEEAPLEASREEKRAGANGEVTAAGLGSLMLA
jgi:gas vesicle protein